MTSTTTKSAYWMGVRDGAPRPYLFVANMDSTFTNDVFHQKKTL